MNFSGWLVFSLSLILDSAAPKAFLKIGDVFSAQILSIFFAASLAEIPSF
jgi:hypothetical protein